ncbi:hypothetical protein [Nocardia sp. 348MFTsu5.1]|uniref:hypothetical protein n=1 Tax=Nocardia sp. 348MFTsu5.1 TaxID=1172185 RepID=UPI000362B9FB|nr:hypothetical protein [Nocardia sp. 348MFTsu5.1]
MLHTNNSGWFDDFAPLSGDEPPAPPARAVPNPPMPTLSRPALSDSEREGVASVAAAVTPSREASPAPDRDTPTDQLPTPELSAWAWVATSPNTDPGPRAVDPAAVDELGPAELEPAGRRQFPMDYAVPAGADEGDPTYPRTPHRRRPLRGYVIAGSLLVIVLLIAAAGGVLVLDGGEDAGPPQAVSTADSMVAPAPGPPPVADADCPDITTGLVTTGRDQGSHAGGAEVIKAFEYAYYVQRSGAKAREFTTELARVGSAEAMQSFIDHNLAPGTLHCVKITDRGQGLWSVELTEIPPGGGEPITIRQLAQTADIDGRTFITAITKDSSTQ